MRKVGLAIIMAGLMIVIIGIGKYFEDSLKIATLTQNNMIEFKEYTAFNGSIRYKLPSDWLTTETEEGEGLYINEFISANAEIYGVVEVDKMTCEFEEAMNTFKSEITDMGISDIKTHEVMVKDVPAQLLEYNFKFNEKKVKKTFEYYLPYGEYIVKVSFTVNDNKVKENTRVVLENIVETFTFDSIN